MSLFADRTSAEVAEEAENERAGLVNTLDQLRENLRPSNVVDEVMSHANFDSAALMDRIWQTARANPIPAVLIGLGAAMLLGFGRASQSKAAAKDHAPTRPDRWRPVSRPVTDDVAGMARVADAAQSRMTKLNAAAGIAPDTLSSRTQGLGSQTPNAAGRASAELYGLRNANPRPGRASTTAYPRHQPERQSMHMSSNLKHPGSTLSRLFDEQPLVLAALGVAVGAAVGAALPSTTMEAQLMGDASEAVRQNAAAMARQQLSQLKMTADQTFDQVKSTVADHGVSSENLSDLVHDIGGQVKSATYSAAQQAADRLPRHS